MKETAKLDVKVQQVVKNTTHTLPMTWGKYELIWSENVKNITPHGIVSELEQGKNYRPNFEMPHVEYLSVSDGTVQYTLYSDLNSIVGFRTWYQGLWSDERFSQSLDVTPECKKNIFCDITKPLDKAIPEWKGLVSPITPGLYIKYPATKKIGLIQHTGKLGDISFLERNSGIPLSNERFFCGQADAGLIICLQFSNALTPEITISNSIDILASSLKKKPN